MQQDRKLRRIEDKIDEFRQRIRDSDERKVLESVFDDATLKALYRLASKGHFDAMGGSIATGKEANVFHAIRKDDVETELAVKIYRISTSNFRAMSEYIAGDRRFDIGHDRKDLVVAWTRKEFKNLKAAEAAGVRVPRAIVTERNILVMEFIGRGGAPAPQLKDIELDESTARKLFARIVGYMRLLYMNDLVHADLSEYNIMVMDGEPVFIDMGQSLTLEHTNAQEFLRRDARNIARFFAKHGVACTEDTILSEILK
ncbi:MAG TPA: serine protein kinase RIO [Candidatus Methanoperedenaceae archaeon]|nr:serine protein kinase RIO [Candidatus Methanoperedenaceae archaeon]